MSPEELDRAERLELVSQFIEDPCAAHAVIFGKDHENETAPFHEELIRAYHGPDENVIAICFRGSAKSTLAEETLAILAASGGEPNCLIVGDSYQRATDRLKTIKRHLQNNEWLRYIYGDRGVVEGDTWQEGKIELRSGTLVWAAGQGQAIRGAKHGSYRPTFLLVDDLENDESVATELARLKLSDWYWSDLIMALAPPGKRRVRVTATPLHPEALAVRLSQHPDYKKIIVPIEYVNDKGERTASWPSRFPLDVIDREKAKLIAAGKQRTFAQEWMVQAVDPATQLFTREMFRFEPIPRTWQPVWVAVDPARTDKKTSATTGIIAASWIGRKIIVWEAKAPRILPDVLVDEIFRLEEKYEPVAIGVETNGLEQFISQPLRHEQVKRGRLLPIREVRAPRGKDDFIGRLQPLFAAGDVIFAGSDADYAGVIEQFLSFPSGLKDVPNAMAYLPELRGGQPVYDGCSSQHIFEGQFRLMGPYTLAVHSGSYGTSAILFQFVGGVLLVHRDWVSSDMPGQALVAMVQEARLVCGKDPTVVCPAFHFEVRNSFGLLASLRGVAAVRKGGDLIRGREFIRDLFRRELKGGPCVLLSDGATWTRRAMTGGFVWEQGKTEPKEGLYRTLMEGLEAAIAPALYQSPTQQMIAVTESGVRYQTADPAAGRMRA